MKALRVMKERGEKILASQSADEAAMSTWRAATAEFIERTFGSASPHLSTFHGQSAIQVFAFGEGPTDSELQQERVRQLRRRISVLSSLIEQLAIEIELESPEREQTGPFDPFSLMHPKIRETAGSLFVSGHYADAVSAAFRELNAAVKSIVRARTGEERDGAALMNFAFSPNNPIIALDDLATASGRDSQQGYMQLFAGSMTGIRNPKAHENLAISRERAIHFLFLASLLFFRLDERR